jgi:hypothetical protein
VPVFDHVDLSALGHEMAHLWHDGQARLTDYRNRHPELPIYDLRYKDLVGNPVTAVRGIYERFGWDFTPQPEAGIRAWLAANPADKHGKHHYRLEDFGLTENSVRDVYADYIQEYCDYI